MNEKIKKAYFGLLREVCKEFGVDKNIKKYVSVMHEAIKSDFGFSSFNELTESEAEELIHELRSYFASEYGIEVGYKDPSIKQKTLKEIWKSS